MERFNKATTSQSRIGSGPTIALDRFGSPLRVGDQVVYHPPIDLLLQVQDIRPVLHPNAPAGLVQVTLALQFPLHMQAGQPYLPLMLALRPQPESDAGQPGGTTDDQIPNEPLPPSGEDTTRGDTPTDPPAAGPRLVHVTDADGPVV